jgi:hypothetical protein
MGDRSIQAKVRDRSASREEKSAKSSAFSSRCHASTLRVGTVSPNYLRHAAAGIQFGLFVLVGTLIGSYLDRRTNGTGVITFVGLFFGLVSGTYFLIKDFLFKGPGKED